MKRSRIVVFFIGFMLLGGVAQISFAKKGQREGVRILYLDEKSIVSIPVNPRGMILSFPVKPTKVILGRKDAFQVDYVENDVAIAAIRPKAASNMFVYLLGRRYAFRLRLAVSGGYEVVTVYDALENRLKVDPQ